MCLGAQGSWQVWGPGAGHGIPSSTPLALPSEGTQNLEGTFILTMLRTTLPMWASLCVLQASGPGGWREPQETWVTGGWGQRCTHVLTQQEQQEVRQLGCGLGRSQQEPRAPICAEDGTRLASEASGPLLCPAESGR